MTTWDDMMRERKLTYRLSCNIVEPLFLEDFIKVVRCQKDTTVLASVCLLSPGFAIASLVLNTDTFSEDLLYPFS